MEANGLKYGIAARNQQVMSETVRRSRQVFMNRMGKQNPLDTSYEVGNDTLRGDRDDGRDDGTIRTEMITNENLEIFFRFRFRNGKANKFAQIFFRFRFRNDHVGHAQARTAGHTYE